MSSLINFKSTFFLLTLALSYSCQEDKDGMEMGEIEFLNPCKKRTEYMLEHDGFKVMDEVMDPFWYRSIGDSKVIAYTNPEKQVHSEMWVFEFSVYSPQSVDSIIRSHVTDIIAYYPCIPDTIGTFMIMNYTNNCIFFCSTGFQDFNFSLTVRYDYPKNSDCNEN